MASINGPVEDLGGADLHLHDAEVVAKADATIVGSKRVWEETKPLAKEGVDVVRTERVAGMLQLRRIVTRQEAVVECLVRDATMVELPLRPLVAVEPDADVER